MSIISSYKKPKKNDKIQEAIEFYQHMITSMRKIEEMKNEANPHKEQMNHEKTRFHSLELKCNTAFQGLSTSDQVLAARELVKAGFMPEKLLLVLVKFNGRIDKC